MKGIGCDLCRVSRIQRSLRNPRFAQRVFTQQERNHIARSGSQTAAALWAAKEACAKALGTGFSGFGPWDVEIRFKESGAPYPMLYGGAKERFDLLQASAMHISVSHEDGFALAFCILE